MSWWKFVCFVFAMNRFFLIVSGVNLLLIGDSFDRHWVHEWCEDKKSAYHNYVEKSRFVFPYGIIWGDQSLYLDEHNSPFFCRDTELNDTVAQFQIFGSNLIGAYAYGKGKDDDTKNTQKLVKYGLEGYFDLLGEFHSFNLLFSG